MFKENFHTHSTYCDGKNPPEDMVKEAAARGFKALGFSGHAYVDFDCDWCMTKEGTAAYIKEINGLKEKYRDRLNIYCGTELDYYSEFDPSLYDFTIGSVHYVLCSGEYCPVDSSAREQIQCAEKYFGGSIYGYAEKYYETVGNVLNKTGADFIGHFDLVTKFNEADKMFDTSDRRYRKAWTDAVDRLIPFKKPFEINTGAIARQVRLTPYPSIEIAQYIHDNGGYFIVTSDCHNKEMLECGFEEVYKKYSKFNIVSFEEMLKNK